MHSQQFAVKTHALICHSKKLEADTRIHLIIIVSSNLQVIEHANNSGIISDPPHVTLRQSCAAKDSIDPSRIILGPRTFTYLTFSTWQDKKILPPAAQDGFGEEG
jgi:hypothetical protein